MLILSPMSSDAWPSSDASPAPLPRIEDLPLADRGYDQEAVRLAFDSFYRHAAQLDASLRALEAVEVFRRDADALRNDLRALRSLGVDGGSDPTWLPADYGRPRPEVPGVVFRLAAEAALILAVEDPEADALTVVEAPVADKDADEVADDESDEDVDADEDDDEDEDDEDESDDDVVDLEDVDDEDAAALDPWEQGAPLVDDEPEL